MQIHIYIYIYIHIQTPCITKHFRKAGEVNIELPKFLEGGVAEVRVGDVAPGEELLPRRPRKMWDPAWEPPVGSYRIPLSSQ